MMLIAMLLAALQDKPQPEKIDWRYNYDEALKEAKTAGKSLIVHFWTTW
jgi:hypothetical protein